MRIPARTAVGAAAALSAIVVGASTAQAQPPAGPGKDILMTDLAPGISYTSSTQDHSVVVTTSGGTLVTFGGQFQVKDAAGHLVSGVPSFAATPRALTASQAPASEKAVARAATPPLHVTQVDGKPGTKQFDDALQAAVNEDQLAFNIGTAVGGLTGLAIGCGIGAVAGGVVGAPVLAGAGLTAIAGCLAGAGLLGAMGAILGAAIVVIPVSIASYIKFQQTMSQPPEDDKADADSK